MILYLCVTSTFFEEDRNCLVGWSIGLKEISAMYFGTMPFSALYVRSSILYLIHCLTGSQCSLRRTGVICSELRVQVTSRAAQFCTYCSLSISDWA